MVPIFDVVVDLQYGDSGKGKVAHFLARSKKYTHILRYNGGSNAGHTIYHKGVKFVTHQIPAGVFFGIKSIIGSGCVVDVLALKKEIAMLEDGGVKVKNFLYIAKNAHIVQKKHLEEDVEENKIGTTRRGIGPAYRDKYARTGIRAESVPELAPYLIDLYKEFHTGKKKIILGEGAQGFGLDIDWGDYPFVTSSHCTSAGALLNCLPPKSIRDVWGVAKIYETYVGAKKFESDDKIFEQIREEGGEYGATTGRPRQCNWLNIDNLIKAIKINGVTHLVINKVDILDKLKVWKILKGNKIIIFKNSTAMRKFIIKEIKITGIKNKNIFFSSRPDKI